MACDWAVSPGEGASVSTVSGWWAACTPVGLLASPILNASRAGSANSCSAQARWLAHDSHTLHPHHTHTHTHRVRESEGERERRRRREG